MLTRGMTNDWNRTAKVMNLSFMIIVRKIGRSLESIAAKLVAIVAALFMQVCTAAPRLVVGTALLCSCPSNLLAVGLRGSAAGMIRTVATARPGAMETGITLIAGIAWVIFLAVPRLLTRPASELLLSVHGSRIVRKNGLPVFGLKFLVARLQVTCVGSFRGRLSLLGKFRWTSKHGTVSIMMRVVVVRAHN